jgi:hypothetical protein
MDPFVNLIFDAVSKIDRSKVPSLAGRNPYRHLIDALLVNEYGLQHLGRGAMGTAYAHPLYPDRVIKMVYSEGNDARHDGYLAYALYCQGRAYRSKHLLKVYDVRVANNVGICSIETLRKAPEDYTAAFRNKAERSPELLDDALQRMIYELGDINDLHRDNVMMRDDDTIVIVDPYYRSMFGYVEHCTAVSGRLAKHIIIARELGEDNANTEVAGYSPKLTVGSEAENPVLRCKSKHDCIAQPERVQRTLLPGRAALGVCIEDTRQHLERLNGLQERGISAKARRAADCARSDERRRLLEVVDNWRGVNNADHWIQHKLRPRNEAMFVANIQEADIERARVNGNFIKANIFGADSKIYLKCKG